MALTAEDLKGGLEMSPGERARASVLVVEPDPLMRNNMRTCLKTLGYGGISDAPTHSSALEKMEGRKFSHILFDSKQSTMPPREFLVKVLEGDRTCVCVPTSTEPNVDDVFDLLVTGAKGFLAKPFTVDTVESAIVMATKGEPISDAVLRARDRNEALVAIMMGSLDKAATILRQASKFDTAKREIPRAMASLKRSAELARTFAKGGEESLLGALQDFCIERGEGPATRLGRLRKRLKTARATDDPE